MSAIGGVVVSELNGPSVGAINSFEQPWLVNVQERRLEVAGRRFEHEFPAHSLVVLRTRLGQP